MNDIIATHDSLALEIPEDQICIADVVSPVQVHIARVYDKRHSASIDIDAVKAFRSDFDKVIIEIVNNLDDTKWHDVLELGNMIRRYVVANGYPKASYSVNHVGNVNLFELIIFEEDANIPLRSKSQR